MMPYNLTTKPSFLKMEQRYFHVYQQPNYQPCPDISFQRKVGLLNTFRPLQPEVIHESVPNNNGNSPPFLTSPDWKTGETHFTNHLMREEKSQQAGKSFSIEAILGLPSDKNPENLRRNLTIKTEPEAPLRANCHFHSKCCPEKQGCEGYLDYSQQMRVSPDSTAIDYRLNSTNNQSGKGSKTPLFHQLFSSNGNFRRQDTEMEEDCKGTKMGKSRHLKGKDGRTLFGKQMKTPARGDERSSKTKRVRTIFTPEQLDQLEIEFQRQQYMVGDQRKYVAGSLRLTEAQVKVWFQNRRIKYRKQQKEGLQVTRFRIQTESEDSETETQSPA